MATAVEPGPAGLLDRGMGACAVTVVAVAGGMVAVIVFFWLCELYVDACERM